MSFRDISTNTRDWHKRSHGIVAHCNDSSTNSCVWAFVPTSRRCREGLLLSIYPERGNWSDRYMVVGRQIVSWESVYSSMTHTLTFLSDINRAVYGDEGSWTAPGFFCHHRCLPDHVTHMFKVKVLIQNQLNLAKVKPLTVSMKLFTM